MSKREAPKHERGPIILFHLSAMSQRAETCEILNRSRHEIISPFGKGDNTNLDSATPVSNGAEVPFFPFFFIWQVSALALVIELFIV